MPKSKEATWLTQLYAFPEEGDKDAEHDYPYEVQYNPDTGERRTVKMSQDDIDSVRRFNGLPAEEVRTSDGEVK